MYIRRFTYKKEDVDCKLCTEFRGRKKCPHKICPYITERIEAGAVTYQEAVNAMVHPGCQMIRRLPKLMLTYSDSFWMDDRHKSRMEFFNTRMGYSPSRNTPAYYAAMYLLTANETLYWRMANCFCRSGLDFSFAIQRGISKLRKVGRGLLVEHQDVLRLFQRGAVGIEKACPALLVPYPLIPKHGKVGRPQHLVIGALSEEQGRAVGLDCPAHRLPQRIQRQRHIPIVPGRAIGRIGQKHIHRMTG